MQGLVDNLKTFNPKRHSSTSSNKSHHLHSNSSINKAQLGSNSPKKVQETFLQKKQFATEGNLNFRLLAFAGGLAVTVTSIQSLSLVFFRIDFFRRDFVLAIIYFFTLTAGLIICLLEAQFIRVRPILSARQRIIDYIPVLKYLWGRGVFYVISGILQLSELSAPNILSGLFLVAVGILFVIIGWTTKRRLVKLKKCLKDPRHLRKYFKQNDVDGDNKLDKDEFGALIVGLTSEEIDEDELEGAFAVIDTHGKGYITLEELTAWWEGFEASEKEEETNGYDLL